MLRRDPGAMATFLVDGERAPRAGEWFRNPDIARVYREIAARGIGHMYGGALGERIASHVRSLGGFLTTEDMAKHEVEWVEPMSVPYRGYRLWELPPNGQGIAALQILNILEGFDIASMGFGSADYLHTLVEAKKLAFEDRGKFYTDMDFADVPVAWLVSKDYADERRKLIDPKRAAMEVPAGERKLEEGDTVYLTVADRDGNMVSLIQSNYRGMGSGMTPGELGFVLQDRAELFALDPDHANVVAGGKRPFHTIIPAFVTRNGEPWLSFGVMGGAMQPQGHVQILQHLLDMGHNLQEAGDAPRWRHDGSSRSSACSRQRRRRRGAGSARWVFRPVRARERRPRRGPRAPIPSRPRSIRRRSHHGRGPRSERRPALRSDRNRARRDRGQGPLPSRRPPRRRWVAHPVRGPVPAPLAAARRGRRARCRGCRCREWAPGHHPVRWARRPRSMGSRSGSRSTRARGRR